MPTNGAPRVAETSCGLIRRRSDVSAVVHRRPSFQQQLPMEDLRESPEQLIKQLTLDSSDAKRRLAVAKITVLGRSHKGRQAIVKAGGIARLAKLLTSRLSVQRVGAAHALCNIAIDKEHHNEIVKQGAVKAFVQLLHDGTRDGVCAGAVNLSNLSRNSHFVRLVLSEVGGPRVLAKLMKTWDYCSARDVCADLLVRLSSHTANESYFLSDDGMEAMVAVFLDNTLSIDTREKVLTALYNVLLNKQQHLTKFVRSGAIPAVIKLLYHASADGKFSALLMTKNLVVNGFEDVVFHNGGVIAVSRMFDADLHELHYTEPFHFHKEIAKTLYELSVGRDDIKQKIIDTGVIPKLVPMMDHSNDRLLSASLKILYGLAVNSSAKRAIIGTGLAPKLIKILNRNDKHAEFSATAVRNLAFDNAQTGGVLVKEGAIEALMIIIQCNGSFDARKQALAAIVNLSNEPATLAPEKLCSTGAVDTFCQEVLTFSRSHKSIEFQWAAWCAVVLHNLMEYDDFFDRVMAALHRQSPTSPIKKIKSLKDTEFKTWMAELAAESEADFL